MAIEVIGAGFGRTGTLSLKHALEMLGFAKCYHMLEVHQNPGHRALWSAAHRGEPVDWAALFSRRDPDRWYESVMNTIYASSKAGLEADDEATRAAAKWAFEIIWDPLFGGRMDDAGHVKAVYQRHNQDIIDSVPAERLLVFEAAEGWEPLCRFLGVPVPDEPYPRVNTTEEFRERMAARRR